MVGALMAYRLVDFVRTDDSERIRRRPPITLSPARRRRLQAVLDRDSRGTYLRGYGKR